MKPGWQTSEFWAVIIGKVLSILVTLGVLTASQGASLGTAATNAVTGIAAIAAFAVMVRPYVQSRTMLKAATAPLGGKS